LAGQDSKTGMEIMGTEITAFISKSVAIYMGIEEDIAAWLKIRKRPSQSRLMANY